jgi:alanine racemase
MDPFGEDPAAERLEPALELTSYLAAVKPIAPGESAGYGRRFVAREETTLATVPIGYGDGWRRGLTNDADVLVGGRRVALVGTVSMDNITLDLGTDGAGAAVGDEAVLLGARGGQRILAEEIARRLGTINYEVTCGIGARVPREHHGGP